MNPVEIVPGVRWVGVLDPQLRVFDVIMRAEHGTTYNSYLVEGTEKTALVDANKGRYARDFVETLRKTTDLSRIDYLILNHLEPDHSGAVGEFLEAAPSSARRFVEAGQDAVATDPQSGRRPAGGLGR